MAKFVKIIQENNENFLIEKFIRLFCGKLNKRFKRRRRFSFVLTGGNSPIKLYKHLARNKNIPWKKVQCPTFFIFRERNSGFGLLCTSIFLLIIDQEMSNKLRNE